MQNPFGKLPDALVRILLVFLVMAAAILIIRFMLPPSIKDTAIHVQSTIDRELAHPIHYAGSAPCADCHDEYNLKKTGYHRTLSCETCHGPAKSHAENPTEIKPTAPRKREFCVLCHQYDPSRPTGFPQINPVAHNPLQPCISCHNPHDPRPPTTQEECQARHEEIARTKAVSPHVMLQCTTCHNVPEQHKISPRSVLASIPTEREFCGKCHSKEAKDPAPPKIDIVTHGEKYPCWQCHYPHMPEVK